MINVDNLQYNVKPRSKKYSFFFFVCCFDGKTVKRIPRFVKAVKFFILHWLAKSSVVVKSSNSYCEGVGFHFHLTYFRVDVFYFFQEKKDVFVFVSNSQIECYVKVRFHQWNGNRRKNKLHLITNHNQISSDRRQLCLF